MAFAGFSVLLNYPGSSLICFTECAYAYPTRCMFEQHLYNLLYPRQPITTTNITRHTRLGALSHPNNEDEEATQV